MISFIRIINLLLAGVAFAINARQLHSNKSKLNDAADVAILAAVTAVSDEIELIEKGNWKEIGITTGDNVFTQNIAGIKGLGDIKSEIFLDVIRGREIEGRLVYKTEA